MSIPTDYKKLYEQEKKKNEELILLIEDLKSKNKIDKE